MFFESINSDCVFGRWPRSTSYPYGGTTKLQEVGASNSFQGSLKNNCSQFSFLALRQSKTLLKTIPKTLAFGNPAFDRQGGLKIHFPTRKTSHVFGAFEFLWAYKDFTWPHTSKNVVKMCKKFFPKISKNFQQYMSKLLTQVYYFFNKIILHFITVLWSHQIITTLCDVITTTKFWLNSSEKRRKNTGNRNIDVVLDK